MKSSPLQPPQGNGRIVPGELVCAHSQVQRINLGLTAAGGQIEKEGPELRGGAETLGASSRGSWGWRVLSLAGRSIIFPRGRGTRRSIFPGNPHPEHHRFFLYRGQCLNLTPRLLPTGSEDVEAPHPIFSWPRFFLPKA